MQVLGCILFKKHVKEFELPAYAPKHSHDYIPEDSQCMRGKDYPKLSEHIVERIR